MSYYGTLNEQLADYSDDARKQRLNDIKQMIKYQAMLESEMIDEKLVNKLATLYSDVQGKVMTTPPTPTTKPVQYPASISTPAQKKYYKFIVENSIPIDLEKYNAKPTGSTKTHFLSDIVSKYTLSKV